MSDYTQEEVRLLDLCAASWVGGLAADSNMKGHASEFAAQAYSLAAAMIAERRKRVPSIDTTVQDLVRDLCAAGEKEFATTPVAQPEPEPKEAGELTEEAVVRWTHYASESPLKDATMGYRIHSYQIAEAVALMREGLAAKQTAEVLRHKVADLQRTVEQGADDLRAADESIVIAKRERDDWKKACEVASRWDADKAGRLEQAIKERDEARAVQDAYADTAEFWRRRAERAERAEAAFRAFIEEIVRFNNHDSWHHSQGSRTLAAHPAPKAEGGAS